METMYLKKVTEDKGETFTQMWGVLMQFLFQWTLK